MTRPDWEFDSPRQYTRPIREDTCGKSAAKPERKLHDRKCDIKRFQIPKFENSRRIFRVIVHMQSV